MDVVTVVKMDDALKIIVIVKLLANKCESVAHSKCSVKMIRYINSTSIMEPEL